MGLRNKSHQPDNNAQAGRSQRRPMETAQTIAAREFHPTSRTLAAAPPLQELQEINERCIELLQQAARAVHPGSHPLVAELREVLLRLTAERRSRSARLAFLLLDMDLDEASLWRQPLRAEARSARRDIFPRDAAVQLARAVLTLVWHSVRADRQAACVFLGMSGAVADAIARLPVTHLDKIAQRRFHDVRPRWEDRPEIWRKLLLASRSPNIRHARDINLRGLQLIAGPVLAPIGPTARSD